MKIFSILELKKEMIQAFDCGNYELNCYLKEYALQNENKNISRTFGIIDGEKMLGYYSLANAQINFEELGETMKKEIPRYPIPAVRLARLAISKGSQRKGLGTLLLKDAFLRILSISNQSGVCFIVVDAKDEAKKFYEQFGFIKLSKYQFTYLLPISTIKKAYQLSKKQ